MTRLPHHDLQDPEWLVLLRAEQSRGKPITAIAQECGMARSSVSMLIGGTYPARSLGLVGRKHGAAILRAYRSRVLCPHLRAGIAAEDCRAHASAPMSMSNIARMRQSEACRACPLNPITKREET